MYAFPLSLKSATARRTMAMPLSGYIALGICGAVAHLPFLRATPINWDSVQFELALSHFDLHAHQPHPPGYILYVLAGRALDSVLGNPSMSLSLLSVLSSAVAVPLIVWLAFCIFREASIALGAALLLLSSPLALYYGSVGLTYAPEMVFSIAIAGIAWKARGGDSVSTPALLGFCLGLAGGVRQTSLVVLLPICAWALWGATRSRWLAFGATLGITCTLWAVPLLIISGGPSAYLHESALLAQTVSSSTSLFRAGLDGIGYNLAFEVLSVGVGLAFGLVPLGLWASRALRFSLSPHVRAFFLWWTLPPLALYAVSHIGQFGYAMVVLPPLVILSALCARVLVQGGRWTMDDGRWTIDQRSSIHRPSSIVHRPSSIALAICSALSLLSSGYFVLAEGPVTASNIRYNDAHWSAVKSALLNFDPADTALVMRSNWDGPFRAMGYLLPRFHAYATGEGGDGAFGWLYSAYGGQSTYALPHPIAKSHLSLSPSTHTLVVLDEDTAKRLYDMRDVEYVPLSDGSTFWVVRSPGAEIEGIDIERDKLRPDYGEMPN